MRLWLDDVRPMPEGFDYHCLTAKDAIYCVEKCAVYSISFDHDLGEPENGTGYDVAKAIEAGAANGTIPRMTWAIHSANPVGRKNIEAAMKSAERFWK